MADQIFDVVGLAAGLKRRNPEAFAAFFAAHADRVYRLALGMLGNESDTEEVTQLTFIPAMEAIDRFEPRAKLDTWLYRIAHNHALMLARKRRPVDLLPDGDDPDTPSSLVDWRDLPEERLLGQEAQERLWVEIARLSEGVRAAFTLRGVEGLTTADCAHVQSITEAACKVRLHRAAVAARAVERLLRRMGAQARRA